MEYDEKIREKIVEAGADVFWNVGFANASIDRICSVSGISGRIFHKYFPSKESLLFSILYDSSEDEFKAVRQLLDEASDDIDATLRRYGEKLMLLLTSLDVKAATRMVAAASGDSLSRLGRLCYEHGPKEDEQAVSRFLQTAMDRGVFKKSDSRLAARHLQALLGYESLVQAVYHLDEILVEDEIKKYVDKTIDVFMDAYKA